LKSYIQARSPLINRERRRRKEGEDEDEENEENELEEEEEEEKDEEEEDAAVAVAGAGARCLEHNTTETINCVGESGMLAQSAYQLVFTSDELLPPNLLLTQVKYTSIGWKTEKKKFVRRKENHGSETSLKHLINRGQRTRSL
jgi:hypothetical protein